MNNSLFDPIPVAASYSIVSPADVLAKVVPLYAVEAPTECFFWEHGVNDTYEVRCGNDRYSLRIYRYDTRTRDAIEFEVAAMEHLRRAGCSVAYAIEKTTGGYITEVDAAEGRRYVILTVYADGSELTFDDPSDARLFGESVATLHHLSDDFATPFERTRLELEYLLEDSLSVVRPHFSHRPDDLKFIDDAAQKMRERVLASPTSNLDIGFCHGDFHGGNVHRTGDVLTHFDFEICGFGYRVFDLATFKWSALLNKNEDDRWPLFLEGYRSVRGIGDADFELIDAFVGIRHLLIMALNMKTSDDFEHTIAAEDSLDYQNRTMRKLLKSVGMAPEG